MQPCPAHLSPFVDNEVEGYIPDRQREINTLAGIETAVMPQVTYDSDENEKKKQDESSDEDEESDDKEEEKHQEPAGTKGKGKGDADSSSDEEDSDSESEEVRPTKTRTKNTQLSKHAKNEKLKKDLQKEQ